MHIPRADFITGGSGVDVSEYHPGTRNTAGSIELRKSLGIAEDAFVTMFVGRLQLDKGLVEFVEAARMVKQQRQDVVFVCNPTSLHVDTIVQALDAGSHVFTEKPVATTLEQCDTIQAAITRSDKSVMVGYNMRFHPALMKVKSWIDSGRIGNVIYARTQRGEYLPGWHPWEDYREAIPRDPISYSGSSASTPT